MGNRPHRDNGEGVAGYPGLSLTRLTVFDVPREHRRRLRTNNMLERLNREVKRRTRVATLFPNEDSLLRLATAVLMETDEEWQTEKRYLPQSTSSTA